LAAVRKLFNCPSFIYSHSRVRADVESAPPLLRRLRHREREEREVVLHWWQSGHFF
jgi:hypothetical protein